MGENREYLVHERENGSISISEEVVAAIVSGAVSEIDGVSSMSANVTEQLTESLMGKKAIRGVHVAKQGDALVLDVFIMVRHGFAIPVISRQVQDCVMDSVKNMTGFPVQAVNVHVGGISFDREKKG